jgi:hypothetical protein
LHFGYCPALDATNWGLGFRPVVSTPNSIGPEPRTPSTEIRHMPISGLGKWNSCGLVFDPE